MVALYDSIPVNDERARTLARAVRLLDAGYRAMRVRVADQVGVSLAELDALTMVGGGGLVTPKSLAVATNLTTSATTALIDRLTAIGLLQREPHPTDRRSVIVTLTKLGEALLTGVIQRFVHRFDHLISGEDAEEIELGDLVAALGRLTEALGPLPGEAARASA